MVVSKDLEYFNITANGFTVICSINAVSTALLVIKKNTHVTSDYKTLTCLVDYVFIDTAVSGITNIGDNSWNITRITNNIPNLKLGICKNNNNEYFIYTNVTARYYFYTGSGYKVMPFLSKTTESYSSCTPVISMDEKVFNEKRNYININKGRFLIDNNTDEAFFNTLNVDGSCRWFHVENSFDIQSDTWIKLNTNDIPKIISIINYSNADYIKINIIYRTFNYEGIKYNVCNAFVEKYFNNKALKRIPEIYFDTTNNLLYIKVKSNSNIINCNNFETISQPDYESFRKIDILLNGENIKYSTSGTLNDIPPVFNLIKNGFEYFAYDTSTLYKKDNNNWVICPFLKHYATTTWIKISISDITNYIEINTLNDGFSTNISIFTRTFTYSNRVYKRTFAVLNNNKCLENKSNIPSIYQDKNGLYLYIKLLSNSYIKYNGNIYEEINEPSIEELDVVNILGLDENISGTSQQRPTNVNIGFQYFDTTINKPIWWNGSIWIDKDGNPADSKKQGTSKERPLNIQIGYIYKDTTLNKLILWEGTKWVNLDGTELAQ